MPQSLYLATNESATGKRMVALGLMELAARRFDRVVFFRPVVRHSADADESIRLMRLRYELTDTPDQMAGVTREEARQLLAADRLKELIQRVQQKFKPLQQRADFAVIEGTSFQGLVPEIEFELNAQIAINLGAAIMPLYTAAQRSVDDVMQSIRIGNDSLSDRGGQLLATIINQVPAAIERELRMACTDAERAAAGPIYLLPEEPLLRQPTLREVQTGLQASLLRGDGASLDREVTGLKVAAMQLPDFLQRLGPGNLVITPGDRSDILAGCALACLSADGPSPTGVVLTGGLVPPESVMRLLQNTCGLPVLATADDTFIAAKKASLVRAEISEQSPRKIESAIGVFERHIDADDLAAKLQAPLVHHMTPLLFEYSLIQLARQQRARIVLPEGTEPRILQAVDVLCRRDVVDVVLLGDPAAIRAAAGQAGVTLPERGVEIIDPQTSPLLDGFVQEYFELRKHKGLTVDIARDRMLEVNYFGTMLVHRGIAGGMVSGAIHTTANTIRPAFEIIKTRPDTSVVSSVFLMCLARDVLVYGDCAIIPNPTAQQLVEIAASSAETAAQFGIAPRIAMLSYSTGDSGHGDDVQRVRTATAMLRAKRPDLLVEGPLQYDAAIDPGVAATKLPGSQVAGRATVFIFPDLNTGNNTYKAVQRSAGAVAIGPILQGLRKPVNDLSRGCTVADIVNTVAITAVQAQATQSTAGPVATNPTGAAATQ